MDRSGSTATPRRHHLPRRPSHSHSVGEGRRAGWQAVGAGGAEQSVVLEHPGTSGYSCRHNHLSTDFVLNHLVRLSRVVYVCIFEVSTFLVPLPHLPHCSSTVTPPVQGAMAQCRAALKPDGLFLSALLGGETLQVHWIAVRTSACVYVYLYVYVCGRRVGKVRALTQESQGWRHIRSWRPPNTQNTLHSYWSNHSAPLCRQLDDVSTPTPPPP